MVKEFDKDFAIGLLALSGSFPCPVTHQVLQHISAPWSVCLVSKLLQYQEHSAEL